MRCFIPLSFLLACSAMLPAMDCSLLPGRAPVLAGGQTESLADLTLSCRGGVPGQSLNAIVTASVAGGVTNRIDANGYVTGVTLLGSQADGSMAPVANAAFRLNPDGSLAVRPNTAVAYVDASGNLTLTVRGLRAPAPTGETTTVQARLEAAPLVAPPNVVIPGGTVPIGQLVDSFHYSSLDAVFRPVAHSIADMDLVTAAANSSPNLSVRVAETAPAAFHSLVPGDDSGTRFLIRFPAFPAGTRVLAWDAIAGADAKLPTSSGLRLDSPAIGQVLWGAPATPSLLLVRVPGAQADATGGTLAWQPASGLNTLPELPREADYDADGVPYLVYEVVDADPGAVEWAEIPIRLFCGPGDTSTICAAHATVTLAPLAGASAAAAAHVPRYLAPLVTGPDCGAAQDCTAPYWPQLSVENRDRSDYALLPRSSIATGRFTLRSVAGGVPTWSAVVDYIGRPLGWLRLGAATGFTYDSTTYAYQVTPAGLHPGIYRANVIFSQTNTADGAPRQTVIPIQLKVDRGTLLLR